MFTNFSPTPLHLYNTALKICDEFLFKNNRKIKDCIKCLYTHQTVIPIFLINYLNRQNL